MITRLGFFTILLCAVMLMSHKTIPHAVSIEVAGVVLDGVSKKPLAGLHVFTKKGEEEAFTNEQGKFRFTSWQDLPITLTVQEPGGREKQVAISAKPVKLTVLFP